MTSLLSPCRAAVAALVLPVVVTPTSSVAGVAPAVSEPSESAAAAAPKKKFKVSLRRTSGYRVQTGTRSTFTGVAPRRTFKGNRVVLQRKVGTGAWVDVANATVSTKGTYAVAGVTTGVGANQWRTYGIVPKKKRQKAYRVYSPTQGMWSLQWFYLHDLDTVDYDDFTHRSTTMAGRTFSKSVGSDDPWLSGWGEYNLGYKCDQFRADIGLSDESQSGTVRRFVASLDGAETTFGDKGLGSVTAVSLDVRSRFRLRLDVVDVSTPSGYGYYGNARVLCQSKP